MKTIIVILIYFGGALGQQYMMDMIQRTYMQQGIPFRENSFLNNQPILDEYDFIIVGSGPAGSSIANRLSEVPHWNVLLLEAGAEGNIYDDIPLINEYTVLGSFSKNFDVEKEENACLGLVGGRCHWPSGNGLGGATLINAMLYTRGYPEDYNEWARQGNQGWSYKDVLPYFLKCENMSISEFATSKYHSTAGPVHIQYPFISNLSKRVLKASKELGYNVIDHNNPETMVGFAKSQVSIKGVKRHSAATAYLLPIKDRPNFHVLKNSMATKLLIDSNNRSLGVEFIKNNKKRVVRSTKEVIVSGGAFGSPKLLMLSGIGPAEHLKKIGIPVIADLPVGDNLQEHLGTPVTFLINTTDSVTLPKMLRSLMKDFSQWLRGEKGFFSSNIAETLGYVRTKYAPDERPDIELITFPSTIAGDGGAFWIKSRNISKKVFEETFGSVKYAEGFTIAPLMMYPKSRGNIKLRSRNPNDDIIIDGNFYTDPFDIAVLVEGIKAAIKIGETQAFKEIGARLYTNPVSGCEKFKFNSEEYWECAARVITAQFHHQCGTCKMGPHPRSSVVDSRLRVHGVNGLRVADASIIPKIPGIHTMAPCYMIGEKASDFIKEDWGANI